MPQLSRLRFVRVGHREARADDLTIGFTADGIPIDSTLWLRNGGGKSSLLALFFTLVVPYRRQFLGKADSGDRQLGDYVRMDDTGVVAAEWTLDTGSGQGELGLVAPATVVVGTVLEWTEGRRDDGRELQRAFFSCRTTPGVSLTALDGLPLAAADGGRLALKGIRQTWQTLRQSAPAADVFWTERVSEWAEQLESLGLDPRLFEAQITMNQGEGEAERLFTQYRTNDDYVRFFLDLLAPPELSAPIVENLGLHRDALRVRQTQLLPEQRLVAGLRERVTPLADIHAERTRRADVIAHSLGDATTLDRCLAGIEAAADIDADRCARTRAVLNADAITHRTEAHAATREAAWCERWRAARNLDALQKDKRDIEREYQDASHTEKVWVAVQTLTQVRRLEESIARLEQHLVQTTTKHAPLWESVTVSARRLAQALEARRQAADHALAGAETEKSAVDKDEAAGRDSEIGARQAMAAAHQAIEDARRRRADAERERNRLVELKDCERNETVPDALARQIAALAHAVSELAECEQARLAVEERRRLARNGAHVAGRAVEEATRTRAAHAQALATANAEASQLARDSELAGLLEIDLGQLDLRHLDGTVVQRLRDAAAITGDRLLAGHVDLMVDQRALAHLEAHGVLPPSPVVERLLTVLRQRVPRAWDGWGYLAETMPLPAARDVVRCAPAIATGIVVRDADIDVAVAALTDEIVTLDEPILLVPMSAVTADRQAPLGVVVGPADDAHLSRAAGEGARARRAVQYHDRAAAQSALEVHRATAERCATELDRWLRQYPPRWWIDTERAHNVAEIELDAARAQLAQCTVDEEQADRELARIDERRESARRLESTATLAQSRLRDWALRHPGGLDPYRVREVEAESARVTAQTTVAAAAEYQRLARARRRDAERRGQEAYTERDRCRVALDAVQHLPAGPIEPIPGDIDALRHAFDDARRHFEQTAGVAEIETRIADARREATVQHETYARQVRDVSEADVVAAHGTLADPGEAVVRQAEASARKESAFGRNGNISQRIGLAEKEFETAETDWHAAGGLELDAGMLAEPGSDIDAMARIAAARATAAAAELAAASAEQLAADAHQEAMAAQHRAQWARDSRLPLAQTLIGLQALAERTGRPLAVAPSPLAVDATREAVSAALARLSNVFTTEHTALTKLDAERDRRHQDVQAWCDDPEFLALPASVGPRLKRYTAAQLEGHAAELLGELELRERTIADDLEQTGRDRDILIQQALGAARDGAQLLVRLARSSLIPHAVPALGGRPLVQCTLRIPDLDAEGRQRIGALLDEYVTVDKLPGAIGLLQDAVLRLAGPIGLKILRPSMETSPTYELITALGKFSGGEKLTVATLLYCALATTRARSVGRRVDATGVLLMDNPFGKASRASFISLQREVARRLGIQLIYLTGINDFEALRCFPNVVRLENARYDRRTGERVVELGDPAETDALLSAVRIARREPQARTGDSAAASAASDG